MEDREPLPARRVIEVAQELTTLSVKPQLLNSFHATRALQEQMEGSTVTWLLEVGWRGEATTRFWELLQLLSHNSAMLMIGYGSLIEALYTLNSPPVVSFNYFLEKPNVGA